MKKAHHINKKIFKISGIVILVVALVLFVIGLVNFFRSMNNGMPPDKFYMLFISVPLLGVASMLLSFGFKREIQTYIKNESVPVFNEMSREVKEGVGNIADAVLDKSKVCPKCGVENDKQSNFCKNCGYAFVKTCPHCGNSVDADSKYCSKCGKTI